MLLKKLLISFLIIAGVGSTAIASTKALLSDQAVLGENTFSTGTVDLTISNGVSGDFADQVSGFNETIFPGETVTKYFRLKNESSDVFLSIAAQAASISGAISKNDVTVTFTPVNTSENPIGSPISKTLSEWESAPADLWLPYIQDGKTQEYQMDVKLADSVETGGASITFDFIFTGTQVAP